MHEKEFAVCKVSTELVYLPSVNTSAIGKGHCHMKDVSSAIRIM